MVLRKDFLQWDTDSFILLQVVEPAAPNSNKCEKIILMGWSFFVQQKEKLYGHVTGRTALWITCSKIFCGCNAKITGAYGIIQYISL